MAITQINSPSVLSNLVANPLLFEFSMSPVETATEFRRFGYQLCDDNDKPITAQELITATDGEPFTIDFQQDVCGIVYTDVPDCNSAINSQPEMEKAVRLKVFEHVFNKDTCQITIENEATIGDFTVLNAANQYWGNQILGAGGYLWLNPMPAEVELCRSRCQLIYLWSTANTPIDITATSFAGNDYQINRANASGVNAFLIDPAELAALMNGIEGATTAENLKLINYISVVVDGILFTRFKLDTCCCINRIAWQHSGGGYSFMQFDCDRELTVASKGSEVYRWQDKNFAYEPSLKRTRTEGGLSISARESFKKVKLSKVIEADSDRDLRYWADFLSSGSYYFEYPVFPGSYAPGPPNYQLIKFIPDYGNIKYHEEEKFFTLNFSGKIAQPHQMPNYEI
jgi:hypothetical protein